LTMILPGVSVYDDNRNEYEVIEMIGHGSFGFVFKIIDKVNKKYFALKTLPTNFPSQNAYNAFINESIMATKVSHKNAIKYFFIHDGSIYPNLPPYIIMEYANQQTLLKLLQDQKKKEELFSNEVIKDFFVQLINGMQHINNILVHRDIKADNILIHDGVLKIADFGLAKVATEATRQLTFKEVGHIKYMAPERWKNDKNTIQNDIYSMGILFYEIATLQYPYNIKNENDIQNWREAHAFQNATPIKNYNTQLSNSFVQVINKMLEKNTDKRYKNWEEVLKDIKIDDHPNTSNSNLVDNLVSIRISRDDSAKAQELQRQKEENEKIDFLKTINYQFKNCIYDPFMNFISEFNQKYTGSPIKVQTFNDLSSEQIKISVLLPHKRGAFQIKPLYDKDFVKIREDRFFESKRKVVVRPKIKNHLIMAWGFFEIENSQGLNLLLLENEGEMYGKWIILKNKVGFGYQIRNLKEPFAVDFDSLEEVVNHIGVLGAKVSCDIYEEDKFIELINEILVQNI
jgi:eukaryotic-like serine/threonine-protein kinase